MFRLSVALLLVSVANMAAWAAGHLIPTRWRVPLDGGAVLSDRARVLGDHKTLAGLIAGTVACGVVAVPLQQSFRLGALFGMLSLAGDCGSSFIKRRLRLGPGTAVPLLDQLPEALMPLVAFGPRLGLNATEFIVIALLFSILDLAITGLRPPHRLWD